MKRLGTIFRAIWNKMLGRTEDKYFGEILDLSYEDLQNMVAEVGSELANVAQAKHMIDGLVTKAERESAKKYDQAQTFMRAGDEQQAETALTAKAAIDVQLVDMRERLAIANERQADLEATKKQLQQQISMFATNKELMKAEHAAARATTNIAEQVTGIGSKGVTIGRTISRMRESTEQLQAREAGLRELMASGALENNLDPGKTPLDRSAEQMQRQEIVAADMERLRKEIGAGKSTKKQNATT